MVAMGYTYSPHTRDERARIFFGKRGKHLAIAAVVVFLVASFYLAGSALTSYATYSKNLEDQLNSTRNSLLAAEQKSDECSTTLDATNTALQNANNGLNSCNANIMYTNALLNSCYMDRSVMNATINNLTASVNDCRTANDNNVQNYRQLARSSVKAICCSFGDLQSATIRNWNIVNNSITCAGNYTVNCTSGETNY